MNTYSLNIGKVIYDILKEIAPTYPIIAEKGATYPFMVYARKSLMTANTKDMYNHSEVAICEVIVADTDYNQSVQLAQKAKDALEHYRGIVGDLQVVNIEITNATEEFSSDAYLQVLQIRIELI